MGTTSSNKGTRAAGTPYVPSWLDLEIENIPLDSKQHDEDVVKKPQDSIKPVPQSASPQRYIKARGNFTRFVKSGGTNQKALQEAVSNYVSKTSGGAKRATRRMGSSRKVATQLLGFLTDTLDKGIDNVLKSINLENLQGQPIQEVLLGIFDMISPEGGTIDEGIARDSLSQTIIDIFELNIDIKKINIEEVEAVIELYITNTICEKLYNEIGTGTTSQIKSLSEQDTIETQVKDFISGGVADAISKVFNKIEKVDQTKIVEIIDNIFTQSFEFLSKLDKKD